MSQRCGVFGSRRCGTNIGRFSGWLAVFVGAALAGPNAHAEILYNGGATTYYTNAVGSSTFGASFPITNLFLNNTNEWAIAGASGGNPQGRDIGWASFQLDQLYRIDDILFQPRNATGQIDGINTLNVWISSTPFSVDVTNATSTNTFLTNNPTPTFTQSGFNGSLQTFALGTPVIGQYFVTQLINTSDVDVNRNLGAEQFVVNAVVPEPSASMMALAGLACGGYTMFRRRKRT